MLGPAKSSLHVLHSVIYFSHFLSSFSHDYRHYRSLSLNFILTQARKRRLNCKQKSHAMSRKIIIARFALMCFIHHNFRIIIFFLSAVPSDPIQEKDDSIPKKRPFTGKQERLMNRQQEQASLRCLKLSHTNCLRVESWGPTMVLDLGILQD